jgi:hypothetical protein
LRPHGTSHAATDNGLETALFVGNRASPENGRFAAKESDCGFIAILRLPQSDSRNPLYDERMTLLHCGSFDVRPFAIMQK